MANIFTPAISGTFAGELVWNMTTYPIPDTAKKYIESVEFSYRNAYITKGTGFEPIKHQANSISSSSALVDISIMFTGDISRSLMQQLTQLAKGINGAGMMLYFYDDWITNFQYTCRWTNAGDFVENSALLCGASMNLEAWTLSAIV